MNHIKTYRVLRSIYVEGLGEFRKGCIAVLDKTDAAKFPDGFIEIQAEYAQGFDDEPAPMKWNSADLEDDETGDDD